MLELLQNFEWSAVGFKPELLVIPGLIFVLAGLYIWLGGLGFKISLLALAGLAAGTAAVILIPINDIIFAGGVILVSGILAVIFQKFFMIIFVGILGSLVCFSILVFPHIEKMPETSAISISRQSAEPGVMGMAESFGELKNYASDFSDTIKSASDSIPAYNWVVIIGVGLFLITAGIFFGQLIQHLVVCPNINSFNIKWNNNKFT